MWMERTPAPAWVHLSAAAQRTRHQARHTDLYLAACKTQRCRTVGQRTKPVSIYT